MHEATGICGVVCAAGRHGEPLACGHPHGHAGDHAWGSLPTFVAGATNERYRVHDVWLQRRAKDGRGWMTIARCASPDDARELLSDLRGGSDV